MNKYVKQLNDNSLVVQVVLNGSRLKAVDKDGNSHKVPGYRRQAAFDNNEALAQIIGSTAVHIGDQFQWMSIIKELMSQQQ